MQQTFKVEGMSCGHCIAAIKNELNKYGITNHTVDIGKVILDPELNNTTAELVIKAIHDAGYVVVHN